MILYTMTPYEQIFPQQEAGGPNEIMISYNGVPILAEWTETHEYRIIRVMSTDPNHYIDPVFMPGAKISLP